MEGRKKKKKWKKKFKKFKFSFQILNSNMKFFYDLTL